MAGYPKPQLLLGIDLDNSFTVKKTSFYYQCWRTALEEGIGRSFTDDEFEALKPYFSKTWVHTDLNLVDAGVQVKDPAAFQKHLQELFLDYIRSGEVTLATGATELMDFSDQRAISYGICTNANEYYANEALKILNVHRRFACVVGYESARRQLMHGMGHPTYRRGIERAIAKGDLDIVTAYAKPGPLPWLLTFSILRGDLLGKEFTRPVIIEDRVNNAIGGLQCHDEAIVFVVQHYDNRAEVIPDELKPRIFWVENLLEVRDRLEKMI